MHHWQPFIIRIYLIQLAQNRYFREKKRPTLAQFGNVSGTHSKKLQSHTPPYCTKPYLCAIAK